MKKLFTLLLLTSLAYGQEIRTKKIIDTEVSIHRHLYAKGELAENETVLHFKVFRQDKFVSVRLSKEDTEKLYQLWNVEFHKGEKRGFRTLDNKLIQVSYTRYMFKNYSVIDITDSCGTYPVFCLPKNQVKKLFNKQ